jgi:hypothetical protein
MICGERGMDDLAIPAYSQKLPVRGFPRQH